MHSQRIQLINQLYTAGIINETERDKAERYLDLSSIPFTTAEAALDWSIKNRIVSREREEEVKRLFRSHSPDGNIPLPTPVPPSPDVKLKPASAKSYSLSGSLKNIEISISLDDIYAANLTLLNKLKLEKNIRTQTLGNLKNLYVFLANFVHMKEWIESDFEMDKICFGKQHLDNNMLMALFQLYQEEAINSKHYSNIVFFSNERSAPPVFENKTALLFWLFDTFTLGSKPLSYQQSQDYNRLDRLSRQLLESGKINLNTYNELSTYLDSTAPQMHHSSPDDERHFVYKVHNEQELLRWIEQNNFKRPVRSKKNHLANNANISVTLLDIYLANIKQLDLLAKHAGKNKDEDKFWAIQETLTRTYRYFPNNYQLNELLTDLHEPEPSATLSNQFLLALYQLTYDQVISGQDYDRILSKINNMHGSFTDPQLNNKSDFFDWIFDTFGFEHAFTDYEQARQYQKVVSLILQLHGQNQKITYLAFDKLLKMLRSNSAPSASNIQTLLKVNAEKDLMKWIRKNLPRNMIKRNYSKYIKLLLGVIGLLIALKFWL